MMAVSVIVRHARNWRGAQRSPFIFGRAKPEREHRRNAGVEASVVNLILGLGL